MQARRTLALGQSGRAFLQVIRDAIAGADRLVLVVGPKASASDHVRVEREFALERCKVVMPVLRLGKKATEASSSDYSLIPERLAKYHCIDFRPSRPL
jgi:TIR domain